MTKGLFASIFLVPLPSCGQSGPSLVGTRSGIHPGGGANAFTFRDVSQARARSGRHRPRPRGSKRHYE